MKKFAASMISPFNLTSTTTNSHHTLLQGYFSSCFVLLHNFIKIIRFLQPLTSPNQQCSLPSLISILYEDLTIYNIHGYNRLLCMRISNPLKLALLSSTSYKIQQATHSIHSLSTSSTVKKYTDINLKIHAFI